MDEPEVSNTPPSATGKLSLLAYKDLIDNKPIHIATVDPENNPNLSVASDVRVTGDNEIVISVNEMTHTQENILHNPNVAITAFDKDWAGVRIFGKAEFFTKGESYDFCKKTFFSNGEVTPFGATEPKGAIVVTVNKIEEMR